MYWDASLWPINEKEPGEGKVCAFLFSVKRCRETLCDESIGKSNSLDCFSLNGQFKQKSQFFHLLNVHIFDHKRRYLNVCLFFVNTVKNRWTTLWRYYLLLYKAFVPLGTIDWSPHCRCCTITINLQLGSWILIIWLPVINIQLDK